MAEVECIQDAVEVKGFDNLLNDLKWQSGSTILTEYSNAADPCGMRVSIRLEKNEESDVTIKTVRIDFGGRDGEFAMNIVLCQTSGMRYTSPVSIEDYPYSM